jgi:hypothetical protein
MNIKISNTLHSITRIILAITTHADTTTGNLWFQDGGSQTLENVSHLHLY